MSVSGPQRLEDAEVRPWLVFFALTTAGTALVTSARRPAAAMILICLSLPG